MIIFMCPTHNQDFTQGITESCADCIRIMSRLKEQEDINKRVPSHKRIPQMVYWGNSDTEGGRWITELTPKPVFVRNKKEFRDLLKRTNSAEK